MRQAGKWFAASQMLKGVKNAFFFFLLFILADVSVLQVWNCGLSPYDEIRDLHHGSTAKKKKKKQQLLCINKSQHLWRILVNLCHEPRGWFHFHRAHLLNLASQFVHLWKKKKAAPLILNLRPACKISAFVFSVLMDFCDAERAKISHSKYRRT